MAPNTQRYKRLSLTSSVSLQLRCSAESNPIVGAALEALSAEQDHLELAIAPRLRGEDALEPPIRYIGRKTESAGGGGATAYA